MRRIIAGQQVVDWVAKRTSEFGSYGAAVGIGIAADGEIIAGVAYNDYNGAQMCMHVAALPRALWLDRSTLAAFFGYPFKHVNRVTALVGEGNKPSRRLVEGVGFELECSLRDAHPTGRMLVYRMFRNQCKWIEARDEQKRAA